MYINFMCVLNFTFLNCWWYIKEFWKALVYRLLKCELRLHSIEYY